MYRMKEIREKLDSKIKELEVLSLNDTQEKIVIGYEISFLKKSLEWCSTDSLTVEEDDKLNELKKQGMVKAVEFVNRVVNAV